MGRNEDIKMGIGDRSATASYHPRIPSSLATPAKNPGASTSPHPAPALPASLNISTVSSTLFDAVPAISGYPANPALPSASRTNVITSVRSVRVRWTASPVEPKSTRPRIPERARWRAWDAWVGRSTAGAAAVWGEEDLGTKKVGTGT